MSVAQNAATACPDSAGFMAMAAKAAGLDDFGDPRLQVPLDALVGCGSCTSACFATLRNLSKN